MDVQYKKTLARCSVQDLYSQMRQVDHEFKASLGSIEDLISRSVNCVANCGNGMGAQQLMSR
jgi:hypothetical protein